MSNASLTTPTPRTNRRYKTQLRDFLSTCRSKRKVANPASLSSANSVGQGQLSSPSPAVVDYIPDPAAVAAAYSNLNPMYSSSPVPYGAASTENLYMTQSIHSNSFYPSAENLFHQYRLQSSGYYSDYHNHLHHHPTHPSPYVANGQFDIARKLMRVDLYCLSVSDCHLGFLPYEGYGLSTPLTKEEKWHDEKYYNSSNSDLSHSTNGRHNFNYDASSQPVNALKSH